MEANSHQSALLERIRALEKEIADVKAWEATKQRYVMYSPSPGVFVYALKKECNGTEPAHWICTKCYEEGGKRILQKNFGGTGRRWLYVCLHCKSEIELRSNIYDPDYV